MEFTLSSTVARLSSTISSLYNNFLGQSPSQARLNAIASYDQSNELFKVWSTGLPNAKRNILLTALFIKAFLSKEMMYSCAIWSNAEGGVNGDLDSGPSPGDLEAAQRRKIHYVLDAARVKPGNRILEFGSGWGELSIEVSTIDMKFN
jgi:cyclopropane-fatty-acyl-phospholipid synthase